MDHTVELSKYRLCYTRDLNDTTGHTAYWIFNTAPLKNHSTDGWKSWATH